MSITIKLFSALREALGESEFELDLVEIEHAPNELDVAVIKAALSKRGAAWRDALNQPNLVHALNHKVVFTDAAGKSSKKASHYDERDDWVQFP